MKVSNVAEAPKPFVWATEKSSWPPNPDRLYVTQLFAPPMQRRLTIDHYEEIENDVIDYYYRILGTAVHSVIEQAAKDRVGIDTEIRVAMPKEWFGIEITGRIDWIDYIDSILADIKTASAAIYGRGVKDDWIYQGNIYRYMLRRIHGITMQNLRIYPLYRDWSGAKANSKDYPASPYGDIELPVWSLKETHEFIEKCVADHQAKKVRFCTDEERWKSDDCYAIKKKGQVKAVAATMTTKEKGRISIPTEADAKMIIQQKGLDKNKDVYIEHRPGSCRRCDGYCDVRDICKRVNKTWWEKDDPKKQKKKSAKKKGDETK